jgi:hypothetical protein
MLGDKPAADFIDSGWSRGKQDKNADAVLVDIGFKGIRRHIWENNIKFRLEGIRCEVSDASGY